MHCPRECRGRIHSEIRDHRGRLPGRTHKKFFNKRKRNKSNPTKKGLLSSEAFTSLQLHQGGAAHENACTSHSTDSKP